MHQASLLQNPEMVREQIGCQPQSLLEFAVARVTLHQFRKDTHPVWFSQGFENGRHFPNLLLAHPQPHPPEPQPQAGPLIMGSGRLLGGSRWLLYEGRRRLNLHRLFGLLWCWWHWPLSAFHGLYL